MTSFRIEIISLEFLVVLIVCGCPSVIFGDVRRERVPLYG